MTNDPRAEQPTRKAAPAAVDPRLTRPAGLLRFHPPGDPPEMCFYPLVGEAAVIGRAEGCAIQILGDDEVSRQHAEVRPSGDGWTLNDLGSSNGLFVGGRSVTEAALRGGDVLRIGGTFFAFMARGDGLASRVSRYPVRDSPLVGGPGTDRVRQLMTRFALSDLTMLIRGETGTGKEVAARLMHDAGPRRRGPLVPVNCAAIPEQMFESQLMGHVRGAFTDARGDSPGLVRQAHGGTLFLDEIGELPLALQPKLLRVIQERRVLPVGGVESVPADVKIVCATNADLDAQMKRGAFREDLYARITGVEVILSPLRRRLEEVPLLARHFVDKHVGPGISLSVATLDLLCARRWPRNIRQLENAIQRALVMADGEALLEPRHFAVPEPPRPGLAPRRSGAPAAPGAPDPRAHQLHEALGRHAGVVKAAARELGISRSQLYRWARKFDIDPGAYRGGSPTGQETSRS